MKQNEQRGKIYREITGRQPSRFVRIAGNETPFLIAFLCYAFVSWLGPVRNLQFLSYPFAAWAALIFITKLAVYKGPFVRYNIPGFLFALSYAVTLVLNRHFGQFGTQLRSLVWICVFNLLIYSAAWNREKLRFNLCAVSVTYQFLTLFASVFSLYTYYARWLPWLEMPDGSFALVGLLNNRLFGIYVDPNFGALFAVLSVSCSLAYFLVGRRRAWRTVLAVFNLIAQVLYIGLSYSRTGLVISALMFLMYLIAFTVKQFRTARGQSRYGRFAAKSVLRVLAAALVMLLIWKPVWNMDRIDRVMALMWPEYAQSHHLTGSQPTAPAASPGSSSGAAKNKKSEIIKILTKDQRADTRESSDERLDLMRESAQLWRQYPLFGMGDRNVQTAAAQWKADSLLAQGKVPHNAYIYTWLTSGLAGILILTVWLLRTLILWAAGLKRPGTGLDLTLWAAAVPLVICGTASMFLQDLFLTMSPSAYIFWLMLGVCTVLSTENRRRGRSAG